MLDLILITLSSLLCGLRSQAALQAENIALRHQVTVLQRTHTKRPVLKPSDRCLWVWLWRLYHRSRTHLSLDKDAPESRPVQELRAGRMIQIPEGGGLHLSIPIDCGLFL